MDVSVRFKSVRDSRWLPRVALRETADAHTTPKLKTLRRYEDISSFVLQPLALATATCLLSTSDHRGFTLE